MVQYPAYRTTAGAATYSSLPLRHCRAIEAIFAEDRAIVGTATAFWLVWYFPFVAEAYMLGRKSLSGLT